MYFRQRHYEAKLRLCYASLEQGTHHYLLGHHRFVSAGQLAGHVVCQISPNALAPSHYLLDFGLGNLRKMVNHVPQTVAFAFWEQADHISHIDLSPEQTLRWTSIDQIEDFEHHVTRQQATLLQVFNTLQNFQENRLRHCMHQALHPDENMQPDVYVHAHAHNFADSSVPPALHPHNTIAMDVGLMQKQA